MYGVCIYWYKIWSNIFLANGREKVGIQLIFYCVLSVFIILKAVFLVLWYGMGLSLPHWVWVCPNFSLVTNAFIVCISRRFGTFLFRNSSSVIFSRCPRCWGGRRTMSSRPAESTQRLPNQPGLGNAWSMRKEINKDPLQD